MKRTRTDLKSFFNKGDIPTEANFADLIDSMLVQDEDNIGKAPNDPLKIIASGTDEALINFYRRDQAAEVLTWQIKQKPDSKNGLSIGDAATSHLFLENNTGKVGIGTTTPTSALHLNVPGSTNQIQALTVDVQTFGNVQNLLASYFFRVRDIGAAPPEGKTHFYIRGDGSVGIGTSSPSAPLTIRSTGVSEQLISFEDPAGNRKWHINQNLGGNKPGLNFVESGVADGRLFIKAGGNVGIGTSEPTHPLHVDNNRGIRQNYLYLSGGKAWSSLSYNAYHDANNQNWVFPDTTRHAVTLEMDDSPGHPRFEIYSTVSSRTIWVRHLMLDCRTGNFAVSGSISAGGGKGGYVMDQFINSLGDTLEQGDVVIIGENQASQYYGQNDNIPIPEIDLGQRECDTRVCGIVHEVHAPRAEQSSAMYTTIDVKKSKTTKARRKPDVMQQSFTPEEFEKLDRTKIESGQIGWMVTLGAFAQCKVDADIAPIQVGDLLTTSPTKGHAQKVVDPSKAVGAILGKALGSLKKGKGKIPVLVMLQ
jgi:hypothetical protein